jgi:hypothetical protein
MALSDDVLAGLAGIEDAGLNSNVTHTAVSGASRNLATGETALTTASRTIRATVGACRRELKQGVGVEADDQKLGIDPGQFLTPPTLADSLVVNSRTFTVVAIAETLVGGVVVRYTLQLRRAA